MSHFWKKEIKEKREANMDKVSPTPKKTRKKKEKKTFEIQRRYIGPCPTQLYQDLYDKSWRRVRSFKTRKSAEQSFDIEKHKGYFPSHLWEYQIQEIKIEETK